MDLKVANCGVGAEARISGLFAEYGERLWNTALKICRNHSDAEDQAKGLGKEWLRERLRPLREFQLRHGVRIYIGEFSAIAWAPGADQYLRDCTDLFNEFGWDWTYHAFREWEGWSVEHEALRPADSSKANLVPAADTPRKRALLDGLK